MNIFLSYNRKNQAFVTHIADLLRSLNMGLAENLFFDQDQLGPGDIWANEIQQALVNSHACVVFIGEQGIGNWQMKEVLQAINLLENRETAFRIIPVIVPHTNRENVQKSFPWFLADTQWIEFSSPSDSDAFQKLVTTLRTNAPTPFPIRENDKPYKGLAFFDVADAAFFFGRTFDVNRIFYYHLRLASGQFSRRFLAIVGNSGSGKSSLARAGLLASMKAGRFEGSAKWTQIAFTPDDNPLLKLATALEKAGIINSSTDFKDNSLQNTEALRERLEVFGQTVVLLIDQFEEAITQCKDVTIRAAFLANLTEAMKSPHLVCIITMRSDFYASFAPYRDFNYLLTTNNYTLTEIDADTNGNEWYRYVRDIIRKPAGLLGVRFDPALVTQLIEDLNDINGVLPALQLTLQKLWLSERNDKRIKSEDYDSLAKGRGIAGVIEEHANEVYNLVTNNGVDTEKADLFKAIFIRLVEITGGKNDVRKTISQKTLVGELAYRFSEDDIQTMLISLSREESRLIQIKKDTNGDVSGEGSRLIRSKKDANGDVWIDVIHEVLIRKWAKLKSWVNERREAITYRQHLKNDIDQFGSAPYIGKDLKKAVNWQKANPDLTDEQIRKFIEKSQFRQRSVVYGSVAAVLVVVLAGLWYYRIYLPENTGLAKYWKARNYRLDEVHKILTITDLNDLKNLHVFTHLDSLVIKANRENFNQSHINDLPKHITYLSIMDAEIDQPLRFTHLDSLKSLSLFYVSKIQSLSLPEAPPHLQTLDLDGLPNLQTLSGLAATPQLQTLTLNNLAIADLTGLEATPQLQTLNLGGLPNLQTLSGLAATPKLQTLTLDNLAIADLSGLEATQLQTLTLKNLDSLQTLSGLGATPQLQTLTLSYLAIADLSGLEATPQLQTLTLDNLAIADLSGLEATPSFKP